MTHRSTGRGRPALHALATAALVAFGTPAVASDPPPVTWSAQLRSTAYFLQQAEPRSSELDDRLPFYERVDAGVASLLDGKLDLRFSARYADDARFDGGVPDESRWFVGYAQLRLEPMSARIRAGRQFLREGTLFGTMDGGWLSLRPHRRWRLNAWAGSTAPGDRDFEFGDDFRYGARVAWAAHRNLRLGAWAARRSLAGETLGSRFGGDALLRPAKTVKATVRGTWEAEREELERFDALMSWRHRRSWPAVRLQYMARSQHYESGSWWERFADDLHAIQLLRGSVRWTDARGLGAELQGFGSFVDERRTAKVGAAFLSPHARVGLALLGGDTGEQLRFYGDVDWTFAERLGLAAGASFVEYALVEDPTDDERRDLTEYFVRGEFEIVPGVELMSELQILDNPVYESDVRLLLGLDLTAGRGASRIGYGVGGGHR